MEESAGFTCALPLASLPDGALWSLLSFGSVRDLIEANTACRSWVLQGDRVELWKALGETFEVMMPTSLGPQALHAPGRGASLGRKRRLRSGADLKRTFFKSYANALTTHRLHHEAALSDAYKLFRMQDSVPRLRSLLRRKWGITFKTVALASGREGSHDGANTLCAATVRGHASLHQPSARWTFNVNHRHGIWEGNTMLNFAVRCGRRKCVDFLLTRMGADIEIPDDGGFTPFLNASWRGDTRLVKQLLAAGARPDVRGFSKGVGPLDALQWAERKGRLDTAAFLRRLASRGKTAEKRNAPVTLKKAIETIGAREMQRFDLHSDLHFRLGESGFELLSVNEKFAGDLKQILRTHPSDEAWLTVALKYDDFMHAMAAVSCVQ